MSDWLRGKFAQLIEPLPRPLADFGIGWLRAADDANLRNDHGALARSTRRGVIQTLRCSGVSTR